MELKPELPADMRYTVVPWEVYRLENAPFSGRAWRMFVYDLWDHKIGDITFGTLGNQVYRGDKYSLTKYQGTRGLACFINKELDKYNDQHGWNFHITAHEFACWMEGTSLLVEVHYLEDLLLPDSEMYPYHMVAREDGETWAMSMVGKEVGIPEEWKEPLLSRKISHISRYLQYHGWSQTVAVPDLMSTEESE